MHIRDVGQTRQMLILISYISAFLAAGVPCDANVDIAWMTTPELVRNMEYPFESHEVICSDGYILTHHRIPFGKQGPGSKQRTPVLVQHGLVGDSSAFVAHNAQQVDSLGFLLADAGFDVWLINNRGNTYSRGHTTNNALDPTYFDFSWHEMGVYDLPESIDYILNVTEQKRVAHIGHSQGTAVMWVMLSEKPQYNEKVIATIAYAPVAYHTHSISPILHALAPLDNLGILKTLPFRSIEVPRNKLITLFLTNLCAGWTPTKYICEWAYLFVMGNNPEELDKKEMRDIYGRYPVQSSIKQFTHFTQGINKPVFAQFDYLKHTNWKKYGTFSPPSYNLTNVRRPVYSFYGDRDKFCQLPDVDRLHAEMPDLKEKYFLKKWAHFDFLYGINVRQRVYEPTIEILKQITP